MAELRQIEATNWRARESDARTLGAKRQQSCGQKRGLAAPAMSPKMKVRMAGRRLQPTFFTRAARRETLFDAVRLCSTPF